MLLTICMNGALNSGSSLTQPIKPVAVFVAVMGTKKWMRKILLPGESIC